MNRGISFNKRLFILLLLAAFSSSSTLPTYALESGNPSLDASSHNVLSVIAQAPDEPGEDEAPAGGAPGTVAPTSAPTTPAGTPATPTGTPTTPAVTPAAPADTQTAPVGAPTAPAASPTAPAAAPTDPAGPPGTGTDSSDLVAPPGATPGSSPSVPVSPEAPADLDERAPGPAPMGAPGQASPTRPLVPQPATPTGADTLLQQQSNRGNVNPRVALALAGGGARGAAHIGVLKVLKANNIPVDFIAGSSMGATIGSLYAAGLSPYDIEALVLNGELARAYFPKPLPLQALTQVPLYGVARLLQMKPDVGLYSGRTIGKLVRRHVPRNMRNVEDLKIPFAAVATNLLDTRPYWMSKGPIERVVQASSTVPILYKPVELDGRLLVDGGIRSNMPTDPAEVSGARMVIAVKLHSSLDPLEAERFKSPLVLTERTMSMMLAEIEGKEVADADVLIEPDVPDTRTYEFHKDDMLRAIEAGEKAAIKALPKIRERLAAIRRGETKQQPQQREEEESGAAAAGTAQPGAM